MIFRAVARGLALAFNIVEQRIYINSPTWFDRRDGIQGASNLVRARLPSGAVFTPNLVT